MSRLDYLLSQKIRLYGAWQYQYARSSGRALPEPDDAYGLVNSDNVQNPNSYNSGLGAVYPNVIYNTGADITLTPSLVATSRFGYLYDDSEMRCMSTESRYFYRNTQLLV